MKKFINNTNNLKETDINEVVRRVKVLLINSKNELLLGYSHNEYQFPGGHVEEKETLVDAVNREIEEEIGVNINATNIEPFACSIGYWKDWPEVGKNRKTEVYYYEIFSDIKPNLNNVSYTDHEKDGKFRLEHVPLDKIEIVLDDNIKKYEDKHGIAREMKELLKYYKSK